VSAFILSTLVIFVAELGDKSQLVALWFATRYRWWTVIAGVAAATLVVHLGSVAAGRALDGLIPSSASPFSASPGGASEATRSMRKISGSASAGRARSAL
jgi:putative Ca2+/H+ antiporter (TMEM165/GDT1 family)